MPPDREVYERIIFMNSRQKKTKKIKLNKLWFWQWKWNIIKIIIGAVGGFVVQSLSHVQLFVTPWTVNARLPCPSPSLRVCSNSCSLSQWRHPTISSSAVPFSSCPRSFSVSGSFPMTQLFISGGQRIGASASASVLLMNIQGWFPLGLTGLISLLSKELSRVFSSTTIQKYQFFSAQPSF